METIITDIYQLPHDMIEQLPLGHEWALSNKIHSEKYPLTRKSLDYKDPQGIFIACAKCKQTMFWAKRIIPDTPNMFSNVYFKKYKTSPVISKWVMIGYAAIDRHPLIPEDCQSHCDFKIMQKAML